MKILKKASFIFCLLLLSLQLDAQWNRINGFNCNMADLWFVSNDTGFVCGGDQDAMLQKTTDGGYTFTDVTGSLTGQLLSIRFTSMDTGFLTTYHSLPFPYFSGLFKTTDGGITWNLKYQTVPYMWTIAFPSSQIGYVFPSVMGNADVIKTTDGGETWTQIFGITGPAEGFGVLDCSFPDIDHGFIVTGEGSVYRTINGGFNWSSVFHTDNYSMEGIWFNSPDTGYAVGTIDDCWGTDCGLLIKTVDGGNTWDTRYFDSECYDIYFIDSDTGFLSSDNIYKTINKGNTWLIDSSNVLSRFGKFHFPSKEIGYVVGGFTGGSNFWKRDPDVGLSSPGISASAGLSVYPVPAVNELNFLFNLQEQAMIHIELYDGQGTGQRSLFRGILSAGDHTIHSDISEIPSGFYICRISSPQGITSRKVLVEK